MRATRSLVVALWSLVALGPLGGGACHVGEAPDDDAPADGTEDDDGTTGPDASTDGADDSADDTGDDVTDDGADDGGEVVDVTLCRDLVPEAELVDGHHPDRFDFNDGGELGCVQNGCHSTTPGPTAPVYTAGGALYQSLEGGRPVAGATVYVTDANGVSKAMVTSKNGFFWSTAPLTPPLQVAVTAGDCPTEPIKMLTNATGNCNAGGCHDSDYQIFSEN